MDTSEQLKLQLMTKLSHHLRCHGYVIEYTEEQMAGTWTVVLHMPGQRLDTNRLLRHLDRAPDSDGAISAPPFRTRK